MVSLETIKCLKQGNIKVGPYRGQARWVLGYATSAGRREAREGSPHPRVTIRPSLLSELTVAHHCVSLGRENRGPRCLSQVG